jgi:hypothetical protein
MAGQRQKYLVAVDGQNKVGELLRAVLAEKPILDAQVAEARTKAQSACISANRIGSQTPVDSTICDGQHAYKKPWNGKMARPRQGQLLSAVETILAQTYW